MNEEVGVDLNRNKSKMKRSVSGLTQRKDGENSAA